MTSEEERLRTLLATTLPSDLPPSAVDVGTARLAGRRRLRHRRAGLSATSVAALGSVLAVLIAVTGPGPFALLRGGASATLSPARHRPAHPAVPSRAPRQFSPLAPYAAFGALPAGFSVKNQQQRMTIRSVELTAAAPGPGAAALALAVYAAGWCRILHSAPPHPAVAPSAAARRRRSLAGPGCALGPKLRSAPHVQGRPAFWVGGGLIWEYAPGAWAQLTGNPGFFLPRSGSGKHTGRPASRCPSATRPCPVSSGQFTRGQLQQARERQREAPTGATARALLAVADHIRYAQTRPIWFPFRLTVLPTGWEPVAVEFSTSGHTLTASGLDIAPPASLGLMVRLITIPVSAGAKWCGKFIPGQSKDVTIGKVPAVLRVIDNGLKQYEDLCVPDDRGMSFDLTESSLRSLTGFVAHLRSLGPNPVRWTTRPLP